MHTVNKTQRPEYSRCCMTSHVERGYVIVAAVPFLCSDVQTGTAVDVFLDDEKLSRAVAEAFFDPFEYLTQAAQGLVT